MRFLRGIILAVMVIAKPVPDREAGGIAIPLTRHSPLLNLNGSIDLDRISFHSIMVEEKILRGLDNHEMNTGKIHPFVEKRNESVERRGVSVPLTSGQFDMWIGEISIGTPPKSLKVQIDTGAADMWVLQAGCNGIAGDRDLWDPNSSIFAKNQDQPFQHIYSDGSNVKGGLYSDTVTIAGLTTDSQTFGSITSYHTPRIKNNGDADGLLGLAFASVSAYGADPLLVSLIRQRKLINPTFSFKLSSSGAEMYLGGSNRLLYKGDITYTRVTNPGLWQVSMDDVRVNDNKILNNVPVVFDTGTSFIYGDWSQVAELYKHLGGTLMEHAGSGYYYLPCDSFPPLGLTFGGRTFDIPPEIFRLPPIEEGSLHCFGVIIAQRSRIGFWNIGNPFLQGVYSVFDYSNFQVGFADLA